jgi:hypothetical protein
VTASKGVGVDSVIADVESAGLSEIHLVTEKIDRRQLPDDVRRGYSPAGIVRCLDGSSAGASRACPV